jgi:disulfide bond formation protein DsbB
MYRVVRLGLARNVATNTPQTPDQPEKEFEFGRGYYVLFGVIGGLLATVAIAMIVIVGISAFDGGSAEASPEPPVATTEGGDGGGSTGDAAAGEDIYSTTCVACHGADAQGVTGLGPALVDNTFVAGLSDAELIEFLNTGRPADDPANTTGVAMPPKGGNPSLNDEDLEDVAAYLRSIG